MSKKRVHSAFVILFLVLIAARIGVAEGSVSTVTRGANFGNLQNAIGTMAAPIVKNGSKVGIYIKSLTDNQVLYQNNPDRPLIPASNEKIVTSVGAYYLLGPNYRYKTELYMQNPSPILSGYYFGDLAIKGYGDPMLEDLAIGGLLADSPLKSVKNFNGKLYIDDTFFDNQRFGKDWHEQYVKEIGALILRDTNFIRIGDRPEVLPACVGKAIDGIMSTLNINHNGKVIPGEPVPEGMSLVATRLSAPLLDIMATGLKMSDNSILEQIFKTISAEQYGLGSANSSTQLLKNYYQKKVGLDPEKYQIVDGSGLSRSNSIPPSYLGKLLEYAFYHPYQNKEVSTADAFKLALSEQHPYLNALSVAGVDGTLDKRMDGLKVYGKTGTLFQVDAVSGYVITNTNRVVVFSILVNDFNVGRRDLRKMEDKLVQYIAENY